MAWWSGALRRHTAVLALYIALTLVLTWPLPLHFASHVTGDGIDDPALAWNLWWIKFRLIDQLNLDIFHSDWMFHPTGVNLAFYTLTPLNGLLSAPLQTAFNLVVANNIVLVATFVLGAYGTYLLSLMLLSDDTHSITSDLTNSVSSLAIHTAAILGGLVYAFASSKLFYSSLGQFNICSSHWIPFFVLYLWRSVGQEPGPRTNRTLVIAGLFFALQAWSELTFASFLLIFTLILFAWRLWRPVLRPARPFVQRLFVLIGQGLLLAAPMTIGLIPFMWAMIPDLSAESDIFARGGGFADSFSSDLVGFFVPTRLHPLFGDWVAQLPFPNEKGQHIYLGYSILFLIGVAIFSRRSPQRDTSLFMFFSLNALIFWLLTLGPKLRFMGQELPIPGPFAVVSWLPFFSGNRYPSRYSVMIMLCLAVLASLGAIRLFNDFSLRPVPNRRRRALAAIAIAAVFLFEHLSIPLPLTDFRIPAIYRQIAAVPDDSAILELPTGWRNGARVLGRSDELIMMQQWYQTTHHKPRLGGNTSRNPEHTFQYFTEAPLLGALIAAMNGDHAHIEAELRARWTQFVQQNRELAPQVLDFLDVDYVVLHTNRATALLQEFTEQVLPLELLDVQEGVDWQGLPAETRLYRVLSAPAVQNSSPAEVEFDLAAAYSNLLLAEGWSAYSTQDATYRFATRARPRLLLDLAATDCTIEFTLHPSSALMTVHVNGVQTPSANRTTQDQTIVTTQVPGELLSPDIDQIELRFASPLQPASAFVPASPTNAGGVLSEFPGAIFVRSAGEEVGDFAHIYVDGVEKASGERGYNLTAIDAAGDVLASATFDTFSSPQAAAEMTQWIRGWPGGTIVAGAVADTAIHPDPERNYLSQDVLDALASVGVSADLRGKFRWSHAFIGVVGMPPGSAVESTALIQPASVHIGAPIDAERIAGAVSRVRITYP